MRYLPFILKNSSRNGRRTLLTISSIAVSLCLLGTLMAIYQAFYYTDPTPEQALRLVTRNRVSLARPLPLYYGGKIRQVPGVREVTVQNWFGGVYKEPKNFFARFATDTNTFFTTYPEFAASEDQKAAWKAERTACMVGSDLARKYGFKLGDRVTLKGDIYPVTLELTVRAIYDNPLNNESLYFHREYLSESLGVGSNRDFAGTYTVLVDAPENVGRVAGTIDEMFRNSDMQTKTETEKAFELSFVAFLGNLKMFLLSICGAVTFTILLVSGNTMAMSVRERVREVGVLKTLGFTNGSILGIILAEAVVLSLIGGAVGLLLASVLTTGMHYAPVVFAQFKTLAVRPQVALLCLGVAAFIGLISSFIPAWNASKTSILDALRHSG